MPRPEGDTRGQQGLFPWSKRDSREQQGLFKWEDGYIQPAFLVSLFDVFILCVFYLLVRLCVAGIHEDQKDLEPSELKLYMAANHHVGTGNGTSDLWKSFEYS